MEQIRRQIPITTYIGAVHHAICTGSFPDIDPTTGKIDVTTVGMGVSTELRVDLAKWLTNLAMPGLKSIATVVAEDPVTAVAEAVTLGDSTVIRTLTTAQLKETIDALAQQSNHSPESVEDRTPETRTREA
jgi:hypothetical protein